MLIEISEKSKEGFKAAAKKLGLSPELPDLANIREDLALWLHAKYMLAVIIEAEKDGKLHDITNHSVYKYEPIHMADEGYVPGSSSGGFRSTTSATTTTTRLSGLAFLPILQRNAELMRRPTPICGKSQRCT